MRIHCEVELKEDLCVRKYFATITVRNNYLDRRTIAKQILEKRNQRCIQKHCLVTREKQTTAKTSSGKLTAASSCQSREVCDEWEYISKLCRALWWCVCLSLRILNLIKHKSSLKMSDNTISLRGLCMYINWIDVLVKEDNKGYML